MFKWFLVGWVCLGAGQDQKCVRMGSEILFDCYEECNQYYDVTVNSIDDLEGHVVLNFHCVESALIEDLPHKT